VTEADTRRGSDAVRVSEEVSSCEAVACGVLALCAAVVFGVFPAEPWFRRPGNAGDQARGKGIWWMPWH
jgi:hypothetical protein